jgi:hypothetical protein
VIPSVSVLSVRPAGTNGGLGLPNCPYALLTSPAQPGWPHLQTTSVPLPMPSQWALQYFDPSAETQLQAGFAHFLSFAIDPPPRLAGQRMAGQARYCVRCGKQPNRSPLLSQFFTDFSVASD